MPAADTADAVSPVTLWSRMTRVAAAWVSSPAAPMHVAVLALVVVLGWFGASAGWFHLGGIGRPAIVTFDALKFANAQRAAASILAANKDSDLSLSLTKVARQAEDVIREEANGAMVILRQAVVVPDDSIPDITDAVLARFGLSSEVPTVSVSPTLSWDSVAPTDAAFSGGAQREDYLLELRQKEQQLAAGAAAQDAQRKALP